MVYKRPIGLDDYRKSHLAEGKADSYDPDFWRPGTSKNLLWSVEQELLGLALKKLPMKPERALDFACGTGRALSFLEKHVDDCVGVDISPEMLRVAEERCSNSSIFEWDLTAGPGPIEGKFDVVTAFRFFLNAEDLLREQALASIKRILRDDGVLIANFHNNPWSLTGVYLKARLAMKGADRRWASLWQARELFRANGYKVVDVWGYGYLFYGRRLIPLPQLHSLVESGLARAGHLPGMGSCFLVVAKPS